MQAVYIALSVIYIAAFDNCSPLWYNARMSENIIDKSIFFQTEITETGRAVVNSTWNEFVGFFPYATPEKAQQYTNRVQSRLTKENIMISIGVELTVKGRKETIDEYLSLADQNMYRQKQMRKESRKNIDW